MNLRTIYHLVLMLFVLGASIGTIHAALPEMMQNQKILYVVRKQYAPDHHNTHTMFPAAANEYNDGRYAGGSSALKVYDPATGGTSTILNAGADGVVRDPCVHFDGERILFSWKKGANEAYHIWEIRSDGSGLRQLTFMPDVDDLDPIYLPDGDIVFSSGREPKYVMCNKHLSHNLYRMNSDGSNILQIANSTLYEGHPSLMPDGRIMYDRWEYVDRNFGDAQGLWVTDPDGTGHAIYYGNNTSSPGGVIDGHAIPGTQQTVCVFGSCHDRPWGAIAIIDHRLARDGRDAVVRIWPSSAINRVYNNGSIGSVPAAYDAFKAVTPKHEDPFPVLDPETGVGGRYFLCSRDVGGGHMAIYLLDAETGGASLVHNEGTGSVGCFDPMPLVPRAKPNDVTVPRKYDDSPGRFYVADVYEGTHMEGINRGDVKWLRVVESPEKRFFTLKGWSGQGFQGPAVNWDNFETKRILGTVPVEADGSAHFEVPPHRFVFFQLLDENKMMLQSMRSGTIIQPGESQGCIGCHESRDQAPHYPGSQMPLALRRSPNTMNGWQGEAAKVFNYITDVQPVLDAHCVSCHDYGGESPLLAGDKGVVFNASYAALYRASFSGSQWGFTGAAGAGPAAIQQTKSWGAHKSKLIEVIRSGHHGVSLSSSDFERLATWVDLNAPYYGSYASNFPSNESGRSPLTDSELNALISLTGVNVRNIKGLGEQVSFDRPASSPCLSGVTGDAYNQAIALIQTGKTRLESVTRSDMAEYVMSAGIDLWREEKYQQRRQREAMNRAAMAGDGLVYDYQGLLAIAQYAPEGVDGISSRIHGNVLYNGGSEDVDIVLVWGAQDMGDDLNAWENNVSIGSRPVGEFDYLLEGLSPGQPLYYRIFASNSDGNTNTHTSGSFDTRSLIDLDADGMSDSWERSIFGGLDICHANSDWDGDGQSDAQEYHSGTDPSDPNSVIRMIAFQPLASDQHRLSWESEEKVSYEIWGSQDMKHWVQLSSGLQATPPVNTAELELDADASYFFRVHAQHTER